MIAPAVEHVIGGADVNGVHMCMRCFMVFVGSQGLRAGRVFTRGAGNVVYVIWNGPSKPCCGPLH